MILEFKDNVLEINGENNIVLCKGNNIDFKNMENFHHCELAIKKFRFYSMETKKLKLLWKLARIIFEF